MPGPEDVSHGDIYHKLGSLEGKLETVLIQLGEKRSDLSILFSRIREVEGRIGIGIGIAIAFSFAAPFLIQSTSPKIHFQHSPSAEIK